MMFLKSIYNFFNKNTVEDFNKIYAEKRAAIDTFFDRCFIFSDDKCIINGDLKKQINDCVILIKHLFKNHKHGVFTFKEKKYLVQNIDYISKLYNLYCIQKTEFESFNKLQKLCPNAVNQYCKNNSIPADRRQLYREQILSHSADFRKLEPILVEQIQHEQLMSTFKNDIEENFLRNLYYKQYFVNITTDNEKKRILSSLEKLDYYCCYNENILKQPVLNYFLSEFCKENNINEKNYQACCEKLNLLRTFAFEQLEIRYNNIEKKYTKSVEVYRNRLLNKEIIPESKICNLFQPTLSSQILISLKIEVEKNERENNEYPQLEQERIHKLTCIKDEGIIETIENFMLWQNDQSIFTKESRHCHKKGMGCYSYRIPFKLKHKIGFPVDGEYKVWQHFTNAFYDQDNFLLPEKLKRSFKNNATTTHKMLNREISFYQTVYEDILNFIKTLELSTGKLTVIWGNSGIDDSKILNDYYFEHLRKLFCEHQISHVTVDELPSTELSRNIVVIEIRTENSHLIETCRKIIENSYDIKPLITYFSLCKAYDKTEVENIIETYNKKETYNKNMLEKEEEKQRLIELVRIKKERAKLEEEKKRQEEERKLIKVQNLMACVSNWNSSLCSQVKYFSLYYYYPTTCDWIANNEEWDVRNIIWNFKASPNKPTDAFTIIKNHQEAVDKIMPDLVKLFNHTFGNFLSQLTLVCIPSSKAAVTERRYKDFSEKLCKITNMDNAYNFVHVIADGEAKHLGGNKAVELSFENSYFNGRYIVLFDDVITLGHNIEIFKRKLEQMGAYVVCAVLIGETKHERLLINPIDYVIRNTTHS